jgi:hypothetical protein
MFVRLLPRVGSLALANPGLISSCPFREGERFVVKPIKIPIKITITIRRDVPSTFYEP